jgi:hypothetical protein
MEQVFNAGQHLTLNVVWDGDGVNPNAALTIFRHFDSASVVRGMVGAAPKTAWLIDYATLERVHYLLVAGFDVYGNLGHQLNTRLYMDFLRMEAEFNFLSLLPNKTRMELREYWYRGASEAQRSYIFGSRSNFYQPTGIKYQSNDPKQELFDLLKHRLEPVLNGDYGLDNPEVPELHRKNLRQLAAVRGRAAFRLPQLIFLTVEDEQGKFWQYTVLHNNGHSRITSMLAESSNRLPEEDDVTVVRGFIGSYPRGFWKVTETELPALVAAVTALDDEASYRALMGNYGVRRTNPAFWQHADRVHARLRELEPVNGGLLDFNRLENR